MKFYFQFFEESPHFFHSGCTSLNPRDGDYFLDVPMGSSGDTGEDPDTKQSD